MALQQDSTEAGAAGERQDASREPRWCVHVLGPDDIHPSVSRRAAMREAHAHNEAIMRMLAEFDEAGSMPSAWAVPAMIADVAAPGAASQWRIEGQSITGPEFVRQTGCPMEGCGINGPHYHRETPDGPEVVRTERRCWCGGEVGPRSPGDADGFGCTENVTHNWTGSPTPRVYQSRGGDPRDVFAVQWESCDIRGPYEHAAHWVATDQGAMLITNCPGRNEHGIQTPPFENNGNG